MNFITQKKEEFRGKFTAEKTLLFESKWHAPLVDVEAFLESALSDLLLRAKEAVPKERIVPPIDTSFNVESLREQLRAVSDEGRNACRAETLSNMENI